MEEKLRIRSVTDFPITFEVVGGQTRNKRLQVTKTHYEVHYYSKYVFKSESSMYEK